MRISIRGLVFVLPLGTYRTAALGAPTPQAHQHPTEGPAHHHPQAATLKNAAPVWTHGSSDGDIFTVIRDGVKSTGMKPLPRNLTTQQIWDVVNNVRNVGPKTGPR